MFTHGRTQGRRIDRYTISCSPCEPSAQVTKNGRVCSGFERVFRCWGGGGGGVRCPGWGVFRSGGGGVRVDVNEELKLFLVGWGGGGGRVWGGQVGCELRIEIFVKMRKFTKKIREGGGVELVGCQGGCERNVGGRG